MDRFAEFLTMATETGSHALARKSQSTYESYVEAYARIMQKEFQMDPFPVTEEKLCGFLMRLRDPTLLHYCIWTAKRTNAMLRSMPCELDGKSQRFWPNKQSKSFITNLFLETRWTGGPIVEASKSVLHWILNLWF